METFWYQLTQVHWKMAVKTERERFFVFLLLIQYHFTALSWIPGVSYIDSRSFSVNIVYQTVRKATKLDFTLAIFHTVELIKLN